MKYLVVAKWLIEKGKFAGTWKTTQHEYDDPCKANELAQLLYSTKDSGVEVAIYERVFLMGG